MAKCVRCGGRAKLLKPAGRLRKGDRYIGLERDPATRKEAAQYRTVGDRGAMSAGRFCAHCWSRWQTEQRAAAAVLDASKKRDTRRKARETSRESALRSRALALDKMPMAGKDAVSGYAATVKQATRSEILALGTECGSIGVRDFKQGELSVTFFAVSADTVQEWTILRTSPTTWIIAQSRTGPRA